MKIVTGAQEAKVIHSPLRKYIIWVSIALIFVISILDLVGWITGITWLKSLISNWTSMKVITALCFAGTSVALLILFVKRPVALKTFLPFTIGVLLILVSLLSIITWLNFKITGNEASFTLLPVLNKFLMQATRMAMLTALSFLITGIVLVLLSKNNAIASNIAHIIFLPVAFTGFFVPVSYLLNVFSIYDYFDNPVAFYSGVSFFALCITVYLLQPDTQIMKVFISRSSGGIMARRMLVWFALLPVVGSWFQIQGMKAGLISTETGILLETLIYSFGFIILIWFNARSINLVDKKREKADLELKRSYDEMENRIRNRTSELLNLNKILDEEIRERTKAEEMVKAEQARVSGLLELIPAYVILLTPDYHVSFTNRTFRDRFGEPRGRRCFEFLFNRTEPCEVCETYKVLENNQPHHWEWTGPDKRIYSISDYPYTDSDGSQLIMEMGIDITILKQAEAKLEALNAELEQKVEERTVQLKTVNEQLSRAQHIAGLGSWELDVVNDVLTWSDEVYNIFGVTKEGFYPSYKAFLEMVYPDDIELVHKAYQNSVRDGNDYYEIEHRIIRKNTGELRYLYEKCNHEKNVSGKIIRSLGMVHDITDQKNIDFKLQKNNERLNILSEISGNLLASENPQQLINSLCTRVMKFLDCQVFFYFLVEETKGKLHLNSYAGIPQKTARSIEWLDYGAAICECVARDGLRIVAENIPGTPDPRTDLAGSFGIQAYACHPLLSNDKVLGTISFGTKKRKFFTEEELSLMKSIADQAAIALTRINDKEILHKSEERFKSLMELSPLASFVTRGKSIVLLNSAARKLLGVNSVEEVPGKSIIEIFHTRSRTRIRSHLNKLGKGGNVPLTVEQIIRIDGTVRDVEVMASVITDPDGSAIQVIMNDITERNLAEKELYDTKNHLEKLIDNANAPIIVWDKENKIRLFNHAFEHLTGYTSDEVNGKKLDLLFPQESLKESLRKIRHALTENWVTIEIPILTKNNNVRIVLWNSAKIYDENKKTFSTIAQGNDITERNEAERAFKVSKEKLDLALEFGKIGIWEWDIPSDVFTIDERMEKMLGKNPGTFENTYDAFEKSIHEEDLPHLRNAFRQTLELNITLSTIFRIKHNNNNINYISTKALVEMDHQLNPVKMAGIVFDITEMKLGAEKELFRLNEELLRSNRELEQFAYVASHDLQEPLRTISSFTQLLSQRYKDKLDKDANEFIQFAVDGAIRMQLLINGLLDYSRIETRGKKFSTVDMHNVLGQVVNNLNLKIQEINALVTNDELAEIVADHGQMVQLLQNLIGNALKFCKSAPRIHISAKEEREHYIFSVKDNGIGIEDQYYDRIFQIFQRLHARDKYGGTGIGLAICKRIVDRHGGKIWVESKPGKGSVFYFTILKR